MTISNSTPTTIPIYSGTGTLSNSNPSYTGSTLKLNYTQPVNLFQINNTKGEVLKITKDGEFYIKGKLVETDKDIIRYLKVYMKENYRQTLLSDIRESPEIFQDIVTILRREKIEKLLKR